MKHNCWSENRAFLCLLMPDAGNREALIGYPMPPTRLALFVEKGGVDMTNWFELAVEICYGKKPKQSVDDDCQDDRAEYEAKEIETMREGGE